MKLLKTYSGAIINVEKYAKTMMGIIGGKEIRVFYLPTLPTVIDRVEIWG